MKRLILVIVLIFVSGFLFAGDIANFVNLGFSEKSSYFMFAQYGINENSLPYADVYTVDVAANKFVPQGIKKEVYTVPISPGQEGMGALFTLMGQADSIARKYGINHLSTGRVLYILLNGDEPKDQLQFRDFQTGREFSVTLKQSKNGTGKKVSASFFITLTVTFPSKEVKNFTVGLPGYMRTGVESYKIRKIISAPDDDSLVFVVEKEEAGVQGINVRYMVETIEIK